MFKLSYCTWRVSSFPKHFASAASLPEIPSFFFLFFPPRLSVRKHRPKRKPVCANIWSQRRRDNLLISHYLGSLRVVCNKGTVISRRKRKERRKERKRRRSENQTSHSKNIPVKIFSKFSKISAREYINREFPWRPIESERDRKQRTWCNSWETCSKSFLCKAVSDCIGGGYGLVPDPFQLDLCSSSRQGSFRE